VIDAEKANYPIAWMCRLLAVPRSSFYAWRVQVVMETATTARRRQLAEHACSVGLMRDLGLKACQPRAYRRTTAPGKNPVANPDLTEREFTATEPGTRLVGDITYLKTREGWLYLATVIDLATRMVVGWQLAEHMRTSLVVDALQMAITHGHVQPGGVFRSAGGAQRDCAAQCAGQSRW